MVWDISPHASKVWILTIVKQFGFTSVMLYCLKIHTIVSGSYLRSLALQDTLLMSYLFSRIESLHHRNVDAGVVAKP
jgi:hypothetical protein